MTKNFLKKMSCVGIAAIMVLSTIGLSGCAFGDWYWFLKYRFAMRMNWDVSLPSSGGKITFQLTDQGWNDYTQYTIIAYKNTPSKFIAEFQSTKDTEIEEKINARLDGLVYVARNDPKNDYADDWEIPKEYQPDWEQPYCWELVNRSSTAYMYIWYCEGNKNLYVYQCKI
jgi:hypothetical protein